MDRDNVVCEGWDVAVRPRGLSFLVPPQGFGYYITAIKSGKIRKINNSRKYNDFFPFSSEVSVFPQLFVWIN